MNRAKPLPRAADPVVMRTLETRTICPAELLAPLAEAPARPAGGELEGDPATIGWVGALARHAADLRARLRAAQEGCPVASVGQ